MNNLLLSLTFLILGCENGTEYKGDNGKYNYTSIELNNTVVHIDTLDSIMPSISSSRQEFLDSLGEKDYTMYARLLLKEFAMCNCLFQGLKYDSLFTKVDQSNGYLVFNELSHYKEGIDSIRILVEKYVAWINRPVDSPTNSKNYSILCLNLYESKFLESFIMKLDKYIYNREKW